MTLTPNFLPVGSLVYYNIESIEHPEWTPTALDAVDLQWLDGDPEEFNIAHKPIPLTPEILTEWCGFEKKGNDEFIFIDNESRMILEFTELYKQGGRGVFYSNYPDLNPHTCIAYVEFLHQLQHLYSALTQTVLPITIK